MCLLFLGVKGKAESEWGSMFVLLSLVWWLIDSSDTVARPLARSRFFQVEICLSLAVLMLAREQLIEKG
jgi:hypothetical protein